MSAAQSGAMGPWPQCEGTYLDLEEHPSLEGGRPPDTRHRPVAGRKAVLRRESCQLRVRSNTGHCTRKSHLPRPY